MLDMFRDLWNYRYFMLSSIKNEFVTRFARSRLGGVWMVINPLAQVAIYTLILSNVLSAKLPGIDSQYAYSIYLMAGLLGWNLFNEIVSRCLSLFLDQGNLIKKMKFPKMTLPCIVVGSCLINNLFLFLSMMVVFMIIGHSFTLSMLWLIPLTLILCLFALGIGLIFGVMNVFIRDVGQVLPIILQLAFWFTPIVYMVSIIPVKFQYLLNFNPMYHFTSAYQQIIVYGNLPHLDKLVLICLLAIILILVSGFLFKRASEEMVDVL